MESNQIFSVKVSIHHLLFTSVFIIDLLFNSSYLICFPLFIFYLTRMNFRISHWSGQRHLVARSKLGKQSWHTRYLEEKRGKAAFLWKSIRYWQEMNPIGAFLQRPSSRAALPLWTCFEKNVLVLNLELWFLSETWSL